MGFQQGLSGLNATSKNLEVIGNNIANANTYGAKASRAEFADMYAGALSLNQNINVGIGVRMQTVAQQFNQGTINTTDNALDVAINGSGFFQVKDEAGSLYYSRNGQFKLDANGFIVNNNGQKLQGYQADSTGAIIPGTASALQLPTAGIAPRASDTINMELNLDSRGKVTLPTSGNAIDFSNPATYNSATSVTAYDVKGQPVAMSYYFQKTAADNWNVYVTANGQSVSTDAAGNPAAFTTMTFPSTGGAPTAPSGKLTLDIPATTKADGTSTEAISGIQLDVSKTTQYGAVFSVTDVNQNGYSPGQLSSLVVEQNGVVTARYSNGLTKSAGQIELASFRNPQGLQPMGGNVWAQSYASGGPVTGTPGSGAIGALQAGALEESNVDLTAELVNMITAQRIYQANAQTIKTEDQILQTVVNLR